MNNLLNFFIEANLYLICFYLLYQLLLSHDTHFRFNRAFLLGGILFSLILPILSFSISSNANSINTFEGYIMLPAITITTVQTESIGFILEWWHIIGIIYFAGLFFYLFRLVWQIAHIFRHLPLLNSARERKNGYTLVTTQGEIPTCSFFKFLFWDKTAKLNEDEQKQIFEHELAHIRQWHSVDVLLVELLRSLFWFNPVIHLIKSRITEVHEYLADHQATKQLGVEYYSKLLTLQIFKSFDFALSNNFHKSQVIKRINMLKNKKSKSVWLNVILIIPILGLLIVILSCNVISPEDLDPNFKSASKNLTDNSIASSALKGDTERNSINFPSNEVFTEVENPPAPADGMLAYYQYIQDNLTYPQEAKDQGIEGKVFVQFIVAPDGKLTEVEAVKGIGGGCDEEAIRVVMESLPWIPGLQNGKKVNVRMILPITFKLG